ncbi:MAG: translational machinery protein [Thiomonas sp.]|uniref:Translational machinery protein n=1 Tax=mine drainage metagenome TaxID=410659 RepID=E6PR96_9ZZZZ
MSHRHAVVWVDHAQAHVLFIDAEDVEKAIVEAAGNPHVHHKRGTIGPGKAEEDQPYYHGIARALADAQEILITGPGQAKLALFKHMLHHDPAVAQRVLGLETVDHPTDGQLAMHARQYFRAKDRMLGDFPGAGPGSTGMAEEAAPGKPKKTSKSHAAESKRAPNHRPS